MLICRFAMIPPPVSINAGIPSFYKRSHVVCTYLAYHFFISEMLWYNSVG